ncbi:hypothetical protein [Calothrix sp. 336/3]|uniref:hypothetical protein n=1 Tax=Calothrix sp. 336/3 TaxID=1337936 RepID=UPI00069A4BCA|nr:hypothetical protein [Calothrix sp. 336/3]
MPRQIILSGHEETLKPAITELIALYQLLEDKDIGTVYSYPPENVTTNRRHEKPKVILFFKSPKPIKKENTRTDRRYEAYVSFRLMNETSETITKTEVETIAQRIKSVFATPPLSWNRGKLFCTYSDWSKGYQFQLIVSSKEEAKKLIKALLKIQGHTPNWAFMNSIENEEAEESFDETPGKKNILGQAVNNPVKRRKIRTLFAYALMYLPPKVDPVVLISIDGRHQNPVVKV